MIGKEVKEIIKNPVYLIIMLIPLVLTIIMSEGTKNYLLQIIKSPEILSTTKEVIVYSGPLLDSKIQFAVSELNFMLMMVAILAGISIFEERRLRILDRVVKKNRFIAIKFLTHYAFSVVMIGFNCIGFWLLFNIRFSILSTLVFLSVPIISISLGLLIGNIVKSRVILSNTILMIVMTMGFFGGALSLTSVLASTKFMNVLMYLSPTTTANKVIFKDYINMNYGTDLIIWVLLLLVFSGTLTYLTGRRLKNGAIL